MSFADRQLARDSRSIISDSNNRDLDLTLSSKRAQIDWQEANGGRDASLASPRSSRTELLCLLEQERQNLSRSFQPREFNQLGAFAALWCGPPLLGGMGCESIQLERQGTGTEATAEMVLRRRAGARTYNLPSSEFQIGTELSFRLARQAVEGQPDRPVVVFSNIRGITHPDDDGERRNVTGMEIHRSAAGLRYVLTLEGVREPVEVRFTNTTAYAGFLEMHNRIVRMAGEGQAPNRRQ